MRRRDRTLLAAIEQLPQVVECYIMLGDCDFLLRIVAADLEDYRRFQIAHLTRITGRSKTSRPMFRARRSSKPMPCHCDGAR